MKRIYFLAAVAAVSFLTQTLSANVIGTLDVANCAGGGVMVTATAINWLPVSTLPGAPANSGCISSGIGTALTWSSGGSLGVNATGWIQDEPGAPPNPFMVFPANAGNPTQQLNFLLTNAFAFTPPALYQGAGYAACATAAGTAGDSCVVFAGSPFLLTENSNGTTDVKLFAAGTVLDPNNSSTSVWSGTFETNLPGTIAAVYTALCGSTNMNPNTTTCTGTDQSTYANIITVVGPEPGTISMFLAGGLLAAFNVRRRRAKA